MMNYLLNAITRWLWVPLVIAAVVLLLCAPSIRRKNFFDRVGLRGSNGKLPRRVSSKKISPYLRKVTFRSRVPLAEWEREKANLELFYRRRIYDIKQDRNNIRKSDLLLVAKELPTYIEWDDAHMVEENKFAIGEGYMGPVIWDATAMPHGLVAGATGGGKSNLLRCVIHQAIKKRYNVTVFDFKGGGDFVSSEKEASQYQDLEAGYGSIVISDPEKARQLLVALEIEVQSRMEYCKEAGVRDIDEYNALGRLSFTPWLLVVDEAAEILDVKPTDKAEKELYADINQQFRTLARISRAAGVHILMGIIRPSADILDGQIKNNLLWRASGYFADPAASRIVLDNDKATELPPDVKGRFIIGAEEVQTYYFPSKLPQKEVN